jgi:transposase
MPAPRKYSDEIRDRAVRMVLQVQKESGHRYGAIASVATKLGVNRETLRGWYVRRRSTLDGGREHPLRMRSGSPSWSGRTES